MCSNFHYEPFYIVSIYENKQFLGLELVITRILHYKLYDCVRRCVMRLVLSGLTDLTFIDPSFSLR